MHIIAYSTRGYTIAAYTDSVPFKKIYLQLKEAHMARNINIHRLYKLELQIQKAYKLQTFMLNEKKSIRAK